MDTLSNIMGNSEYASSLDFAQSGPAQNLRIYVDGYQNDGSGDGSFSIDEFQNNLRNTAMAVKHADMHHLWLSS